MPDFKPAPAATPTVILSPIRSALPQTGGTLEVLVRIQAPAQPPVTTDSGATARPPLRLALVVDRSGSMDGHPWLQDKIKGLQALVERDAFMAQKELRYSQVKMSSRLSSEDALRYSADQTDRGDIPSFLRRKSSEGKGRKA